MAGRQRDPRRRFASASVRRDGAARGEAAADRLALDRRCLAGQADATPRADVLIMETTFGLPRYVFPPQEKIEADIVNFCRQALADKVTPVLYAYSLGKTQELLQIVGGAGLPVMLHANSLKMTKR